MEPIPTNRRARGAPCPPPPSLNSSGPRGLALMQELVLPSEIPWWWGGRRRVSSLLSSVPSPGGFLVDDPQPFERQVRSRPRPPEPAPTGTGPRVLRTCTAAGAHPSGRGISTAAWDRLGPSMLIGMVWGTALNHAVPSEAVLRQMPVPAVEVLPLDEDGGQRRRHAGVVGGLRLALDAGGLLHVRVRGQWALADGGPCAQRGPQPRLEPAL